MRDALRLLEMQRHGMLMYTSCGWFFDEISGLETTQCLHYAARAIHLAKHFRGDWEKRFTQALKAAPSNLPQFRSGRGVWEQIIRPAVIDLDRVLAHHAISLIYPARDEDGHGDCFDVTVLDREVRGRGGSHLAVGRLRVRSRQTWDEAETAFVVVHYGGLDFHTVLRRGDSPREYEAIKRRLLEAYKGRSLADVTTLLARDFEGKVHRLDDLFIDEQRRVIGIVLQDRVEDYHRTFEHLTDQDDDVLNRLGRMHHPIPKPLWAVASSHLDLRLLRELGRLEEGGDLAPIQVLYERGRTWGYQPERAADPGDLRGAAADPPRPRPRRRPRRAGLAPGLLLDASALLGVTLDLWQVQNQLLDAFIQLSDSGAMPEPLRQVFVELAVKLDMAPDLLGWRP